MTDDAYDLITLSRTYDRELRFRGRLIGEGRTPGEPDRGTTVRVYESAGMSYVVHHIAWSNWQGESDTMTSVVCEASEVLDALRDDEGRLMPEACEAWDTACEADASLAQYRYEELP